MRQLTILENRRHIRSKEEILNFEKQYGINFPEYFVDFIFKYEGCSIKEYVYKDDRDNEVWYAINQVLYLKNNAKSFSIEDYLASSADDDFKWLPFANDPGGWLFLISISSHSLGEVWKLSLDGEMKLVALDFIKFIDGLMSFDEAVNLGY